MKHIPQEFIDIGAGLAGSGTALLFSKDRLALKAAFATASWAMSLVFGQWLADTFHVPLAVSQWLLAFLGVSIAAKVLETISSFSGAGLATLVMDWIRKRFL
jgi:hypothetical protein